MNLRNTAILFALFLSALWVFGVMLATKQPIAEEGFLIPSLKALPEVVVDSIHVERNEDKTKDSFSFVRDGDAWRLIVGKQSTAVETVNVKKLIERMKTAKNNPDAETNA